MKNSLFIIITALMGLMGARAEITADWKIHMPFDTWPTQVIETPARVYFMSRTFEYKKSLPERAIPSHSLFYYDKEGDEIISLNERVNANGNAVASMAYNSERKYLLVVYTDCNIDFFYDDGRVFNVPALKASTVPGKKDANSITFDYHNHRAYVATTFGYISLNDDRHEVAESRIYGENLQSVARVGSNFVVCRDYHLYHAPAEEQRFNFDDYTLIEEGPEANYIAPFLYTDNFAALKIGEGESDITMYTYDVVSHKYRAEKIGYDNNVLGIQHTPNQGYLVSGNVTMHELNPSGFTRTVCNRVQEDFSMPASSYNNTDLWVLCDRKGLRSYRIKRGEGLELTRDHMRPNAPASYIATSLAYIPDYGILCGSNGIDLAYGEFNQQTPSNISALKGGFWKEYGVFYADHPNISNLYNYGGLGVDPRNPNHIYRSNTTGGLMRVNMDNPSEILIMANPSNGNSGKDGFIKVVDDMAGWNILCHFTVPQFANDGTMWCHFYNRDIQAAELWYWTAADRLATTSAATYRPMHKFVVPEFVPSNNDVMITLTQNPNIIVIGGHDNNLIFYDHKGTLGITSDDRYAYFKNIYDQDGGSVNFLGINGLFEDPQTGLVWILTQRGVFTVNPQTAFEDPTKVNRIKVARNDGTNLADYLLNEINVHTMNIDGEGRKWFSTSNGLVCTSADGRTILGEFTTDNSYLPSNTIYATQYNPDNNSIMVATEGGLVEMFPSGSGGASTPNGNAIRIYPNPVEPDFYGWVRIDNVSDGSLVKITDSTGGIVKELGPVQGGSVEWDISGLNNRRVSTGVYYVMVSPGSGGGETQISKILVMN